MPLIHVDATRITDWTSFHDVFAERFGFPGFYGRNMDAWIDCMTYLDEPDAAMTSVHGSTDDIVVVQVDNVELLPANIYDALIECSCFVNWRRIEKGPTCNPCIVIL